MKKRKWIGAAAAGICAGAVNGLFGAGGGMVLVPLLTMWTDLEEDEIFPASISVILPMCLVSLVLSPGDLPNALSLSVPYLIGGAGGGILAGLLGKRIPTVWLHRLLGCLILWGGIRYLC